MAKKIVIPIDLELKAVDKDVSSTVKKIQDSINGNKAFSSNSTFTALKKQIQEYYDALNKLATTKLTSTNVESYSASVDRLSKRGEELKNSYAAARIEIEKQEVALRKANETSTIAESRFSTLAKKVLARHREDPSSNLSSTLGIDINDASKEEEALQKITALLKEKDVEVRKGLELTKQESKERATAQGMATRYQNTQKKANEMIAEGNKVLLTEKDLIQSLAKALSAAQDTQEKFNITEQEANRQETLNALKSKIKYYTSFAFSIQLIRQQLRQIVDTFKEVDKNITSISMVSGISRDSLWANIDTYNALAKELGSTTNEVLEASVIFYQQGRSTNDVLILVQDSLKLAAIAGIDTAAATDYLTTAINGFKLSAEDASTVTDTWANLAANTAVSVEELATAISKTASISQSAGMSLESTSAFLAQIISTTREAAETAGTALKTIIARFQELKTSEGALEDGVDANKVEKALRSADVALRDTNGQFRNFDDVILELASKWDGLSRNTQRYIATIAAGSRQQSRFIALVSDYDGLLENLENAYDSAGAAEEQFGTYTEGLEASFNKLKSSWEGFYLSLQSGTSIVSAGADMLSELLTIASKIGILPTTAIAMFTVQLGKFATGLLFATDAVKKAKIANSLLGKVYQILTAKQSKLILSETQLEGIRIANLLLAKGGEKDEKNLASAREILAAHNFTAAETELLLAGAKETGAVATDHLTKKVQILNTSALPTVGIILLIVGALAGLAYAIYQAVNADEIRLKQLKEEAGKSREYAQEQESLLESYDNLYDRLKKVGTGEEELENVRKDLISQLGYYYEGVNLLTASYTDLLDVTKKVQQEQAYKAASANYAAMSDSKALENEQAAQDWLNNEANNYREQVNVKQVSVAPEDTSELSIYPPQYEYETSDGQRFSSIDAAKEHEVELYAQSIRDGYAIESKAAGPAIDLETADSLLIEHVGNWDKLTEEEKNAYRYLAQYSNAIEEIPDKDGNTIGVKFKDESLEGVEDFLDKVEETDDLEFIDAVNDLMAGELDWVSFINEPGYEKLLNSIAENNNFADIFIQKVSADFERQKTRIANMVEEAFYAENEHGSYIEQKNGSGWKIYQKFGGSNDENLDLKEAFLKSFNSLSNDPELQEAYTLAVNRLIEGADDISLITPEMLSILGDTEKITDAYKGMLSLEGNFDDSAQEAFFKELQNQLGEVQTAFLNTEYQITKFQDALNGLNSLKKGLPFEEAEIQIEEMATAIALANDISREAAKEMLYNAVVVDEEGNAYLNTTDEIERYINTTREQTIEEANLTAQTLENDAKILDSIADKIEAQTTGGIVTGEVFGKILEDLSDQEKAVLTETNAWDTLNKTIEGEKAAGAVQGAFSNNVLDGFKEARKLAAENSKIDGDALIENIRQKAQELRAQAAEIRARVRFQDRDTSSGGSEKSSSDTNKEYLNALKEAAEAAKEAAEDAEKAAQAEIKAIQAALTKEKEVLKERQQVLKDAFDDEKDLWQLRLEYVQSTLQAEQAALEEAADTAKDNANKEIDYAQKAADARIEALQAQIDAIDEEADAENRLLDLQKARDAYERARTSKTRLVLTRGAGWVFKTDNAEVADTKSTLNETERDYQKRLLEDQIAEIEKINAILDKLAEYGNMTAKEIQELTRRMEFYGNFLLSQDYDGFLENFGNIVTDEETGIDYPTFSGILADSIKANDALADWNDKYGPILEEIEQQLKRVGMNTEELLREIDPEWAKTLDSDLAAWREGGESIIKSIDNFINTQTSRAQEMKSIEEQIEIIEQAINDWSEILELLGLSTTEIKEANDRSAKYESMGYEQMLKDSKLYEKMFAQVQGIANLFQIYQDKQAHYESEEEAKGSHSAGGIVDYYGLSNLHGSSNLPEIVLNNRQAAALFNWIKSLPNNGLPIPKAAVPTINRTRTVNESFSIGVVNIQSNTDSLDKLVTDIKRQSPLIKHR